MARCETCGNDYDKAFQVSMNGRTHTFDSFECAIHALTPTCDNCGIHIVRHGFEKEGTFFCCVHCAEVKGVMGLRDRIGAGGVIETGSLALASVRSGLQFPRALRFNRSAPSSASGQ